MPATLATFQNILKEFYIGPVIEELNNEIFVLEMFEKAVIDWQGRVAIIPVHVSRNTGVGFRAEGQGALAGSSSLLPVAGDQGFEQLQVNAQYQYGRFQITGPAISAAKSGGRGSFIGYVDAEMKKLVNDVKNSSNSASVNGNALRGYICDKQAAVAGSAANQLATNVATFATAAGVFYNGDHTAFAGCDDVAGGLASTSTWVPIRLIRTDTFQDIPLFDPGGNPIDNPNFFVGNSNPALGTLNIYWGDNGGGIGSLRTDMITPGFGIAVAINYINATDSVPNPVGLQIATPTTNLAVDPLGVSLTALEPVGIYGNQSDSAFFGMTRANLAANAVPQLQGFALCNSTVAGAIVGHTALTLNRMQQCMDIVHTDGLAVPVTALNAIVNTGGGTTPNGGGREADIIMMNPVTRQQYTNLLQNGGAALFTDTVSAKHGDAGYTSLGYGGLPIKTSRAVHRGVLCFLRKDTWNIAELESAGFADLDGNVLSRLLNTDAYQGFYRWYWNLLCKQPNANVVLFGVRIV